MNTFCHEHFPDEPSIQNETTLLRRIPERHVYYDDNLQRFRPSSAAFEDDGDRDPMSVYLSNVLVSEGRDPATVLRGHSGYSLASITAGLAREHKQTVHPDPLRNETAHAVVCGVKKKAVKRMFAVNASWVVEPPAKEPASKC